MFIYQRIFALNLQDTEPCRYSRLGSGGLTKVGDDEVFDLGCFACW